MQVKNKSFSSQYVLNQEERLKNILILIDRIYEAEYGVTKENKICDVFQWAHFLRESRVISLRKIKPVKNIDKILKI